MIKAMNHVGLSVAYLDRSVKFYQATFGMEVVVRREFSGEEYAELLGFERVTGEVALLKAKETDLQLELFEFTHPVPKSVDGNRPVCDHGITHFCLEVTDIESEYRRMMMCGVSFHCAPIRFKSGNTAAYGRDPDGNVFELVERGARI